MHKNSGGSVGAKVTTPKCDTCFLLVNLGGGEKNFIGRAISKCKRN
jgi:hypothetical protein